MSIRILSRNFHSIDYDNFRKDILNSSSCDKPLFENLVLDSAVDLYNNTLSKLFDRHCPKITKVYKTKFKKTKWYTNQLHSKKKAKRQAERKLKKHQTYENLTAFKTLKKRI